MSTGNNRDARHFGGFTFFPLTGELFHEGRPVPLSPTPVSLLEMLTDRPCELVTRQEIWERLWPQEWLDRDQRLNYCVYQLRRALADDASNPRIIQTLPTRGYRLVLPVKSGRGTVLGLTGEKSKRPGSSRLRWVAGVLGVLVGVLVAMVYGTMRQSPASNGVANASASKPYRMGRYVLELPTPDLDLAAGYFGRSLRADSTYAPAYLGMALIREEQGDLAVAQSLLEKALQYDAGLAEAHVVRGRWLLFKRWDAARAGSHLHAAASLDTSRVDVQHLLAHHAIITGNARDAIAYIERAQVLDPAVGISQGDVGWIYYWAGEFERAAASCEESRRLTGTTSLVEACLLSAWLAQGRLNDAAKLVAGQLQSAGLISSIDEASNILPVYFAWRIRLLSQIPGTEYARARLAAALGWKEQAIRHLQTAIEERRAGVQYAPMEPLFKSLHGDARFLKLTEQIRNQSADRAAA